MIYYHVRIFVPRAMEVRAAQGFGNGFSFGADFYPIWLTAREGLIHPVDLYSAESTRQIQIGLFGRAIDGRRPTALRDYRAFAYPAFTELLFWPGALLPFSVARVGLAMILAAMTACSVILWLGALRLKMGNAAVASLILLTLSSYVVLEGLFADQLGLLVGFFLAASIAALVEGRLMLAGSMLAVTLIKPQMTFLVVGYLLFWSFAQWRVRWKFASSFLVVSSALGISSLLIWPHWISEWLRVVFGYREYATPALACYLLGSGNPLICAFLIAALVAGAMLLAWRMRGASLTSTEFALTIGLLLAVTTIALLPGHAVYDQVVLLPGIFLIAFLRRDSGESSFPFRALLAATVLALFWQWMFAPIAIAFQPILSRRLFLSFVLTLPIRTAASIPFGALALLAMMMRREWKRSPNECFAGTSSSD
ncbi:MAG: glycosyltransferase family 87 protein [Candidatus Sulfotelmatobacter sp.]